MSGHLAMDPTTRRFGAGVVSLVTTIVLAGAAVGALPAQAASPVITIHVAPGGADTADGSAAHPIASLHEAQARVRAALVAGAVGVEVSLADGTYRLGSTLQLDASDSGTQAAPVLWRAEVGAHPVIAGGRELHPTWSPYQGSIVVADVGMGLDFDQLFVDDQRQILARYPNYTPGQVLDGYAADAISPARTAGWSDPTTAEVRALHTNEWGGNSYRITGRNGDGTLALAWVGDNQRGGGAHPTYRMVENVFEELDSPGEWFYDKTSGRLYYWPSAGVDVSVAHFSVAELDELVRVEGTSAAAPAHDIELQGLTFTATHRTLFDSTFEPVSLSDWSIVRKAAVLLRNTQRVSILGSTFEQLGGNGVFVDGYGQGDEISDNRFDDVGASAIAVVGSESAVRQPSTWGHELRTMTDLVPGPLTEAYPREITVANNAISNLGVFEKQTAGVEISRAFRIAVTHNTIHDGPRAAINIGDGTWGGHRIADNDIWNMVQETGDHGPINAWGRDRWWPISNATDAQRKAWSALDALEPTVIEHNRIWHHSEWAVDLDDGASNYVLRDNLFLNAGTKFREGFNRTSTNNIYVDGAAHSHVSFSDTSDQVTHNIFLQQAPYRFIQADPAQSGINYADNVFWAAGASVGFSPYGSSLAQWQAGRSQDLGSVVADPQFVAGSPWLDGTQLDFSVAAASPALARGFQNFAMDGFGAPGSTERPPAVTFDAVQIDATRESLQEPWLGAQTTGIFSPALASSVGLAGSDGLYLQQVSAGSAAHDAGLRTGDVIRSIDGSTVTDKFSFWSVWNNIPAGATVALGVWRNQAPVAVSTTRPGGVERINNTSGVAYTGTDWLWRDAARGGASSSLDDIDATQHAGDRFSVAFHGTRLVMFTETNTDETPVQISVDGGPAVTIDLRTPSRVYQAKVFDTGDLASGEHTVTGTSTTGGFFIVDAFDIHRDQVLDTTAPTTRVVLDPAQPDGENGWYVHAPAFSLTADDGIGSGVASTSYVVGATNTWTSYGGGAVSLEQQPDGRFTVGFRSKDLAGNLEPAGSVEVKLDRSAPAVTAHEAARTVSITATDDASGVGTVEYSLDGAGWLPYLSPISVEGNAHQLDYRARDLAGNRSILGRLAVAASDVASAGPPRAYALPRVSGPVVVGGRLQGTPGTWDLAGLSYHYQWLRDGIAIPGATTSEYQIRAADVGASLSLVVQADQPGRATGVVVSEPTTMVPKVRTRVHVRQARVAVGPRVRLAVVVSAHAVPVKGRIRVRVGRVVRVVGLRHGRATVRVLAPHRGSARAVVTFRGTAVLARSRDVLRLRA
jgi:hypothetical protein